MIELETALFSFYNRTIKIELGQKEVKSGKFESCKFYPFFAELFIQKNPEKTDKLRIPLPFKVEHHEQDGLIYLDYRIVTFNRNTKTDFDKEDVSNINHHKYFDKILTISINE